MLFWNLKSIWLRFERTLTNRGALLYLSAPPISVFYSFLIRPVFPSFNSCLPILRNGCSTSQALAQSLCYPLQLSMFLLRGKASSPSFFFSSFYPSSAPFINWPVTISMICPPWSAWISSSVFPELDSLKALWHTKCWWCSFFVFILKIHKHLNAIAKVMKNTL